jgi:hypothetical protein
MSISRRVTAELLPVPYYHVVFTLPAAIADIAYQNKAWVSGDAPDPKIDEEWQRARFQMFINSGGMLGR